MSHPTTKDLLPQDWDRLSRKELISASLWQQRQRRVVQMIVSHLDPQRIGEKFTSAIQPQLRGSVDYLRSPFPQTDPGEAQSPYLHLNHSRFFSIYAQTIPEPSLQQKLKQFTRHLLIEQHPRAKCNTLYSKVIIREV